MSYVQIHKGAGLTIMAVIVVVVCIWVLFRSHPGSAVFGSCAQARKAGQSNIPKSSKFYNPALDRDHDNVACE